MKRPTLCCASMTAGLLATSSLRWHGLGGRATDLVVHYKTLEIGGGGSAHAPTSATWPGKLVYLYS